MLEDKNAKEIFENWGFKNNQLTDAVKTITSNKKRWVDFMMLEELGLVKETLHSPATLGAWTFLGFIFAAIIPLIAYFFLPVQQALPVAIAISGLFLFIFGAGRTIVTNKKWYWSGLEMLTIGLVATGVTYAIGTLFSQFYPQIAAIL